MPRTQGVSRRRAAWNRAPLRSLPVAVCAVAVLAGVLAACSSASGTGTPTTSASGGVDRPGVTLFATTTRQLAPRLSGSSIAGESLTLDDSAEQKITVVNVWASWCEPCRDESPMLASMAKQLSSSGVQFFGIDERDTNAKARAFARSTHMDYSHFSDPDGAVLRKLQFLPQLGIPSTLILDRHGRMAARIIGPARAAVLQQIIDDLVKES
jgi:thiol-disulfide isomerase/thioredoxin